jgi:small subunit ribosomal protein S14
MAKTAWIERNKKKAETVKKYAAIRAELKARRDYAGLSKLPRNASPSRVVNRCSMSGRRHGYLRVSVDGHRIIDHEGRTRLKEPVDSMQILKVYTGAYSLHRGPAYQWVDDLEIRRGLLSPPALRRPAPARR